MLYHKTFPVMPKGAQQLSSMGSTDDYTSVEVSQDDFMGVYAERGAFSRPTTADYNARKGGLGGGGEGSAAS